MGDGILESGMMSVDSDECLEASSSSSSPSSSSWISSGGSSPSPPSPVSILKIFINGSHTYYCIIVKKEKRKFIMKIIIFIEQNKDTNININFTDVHL